MNVEDPCSLPLFGIYGAGGCGRGVIPVADEMLALRLGKGSYSLVFIDDEVSGSTINGYSVLSYEQFGAATSASRAVAVAVADSKARCRIATRCERDDIGFFPVRASNAVVMDDVRIGDGAIISPFVTFTSNIRIGRQFHANIYSYVEHDCEIGDFVTFAPSVQCNGNVIIEDHAYLGAGCVLRQGRTDAPLLIGRGAVVGMGAIVTKSVSPGVTVIGNPARPL